MVAMVDNVSFCNHEGLSDSLAVHGVPARGTRNSSSFAVCSMPELAFAACVEEQAAFKADMEAKVLNPPIRTDLPDKMRMRRSVWREETRLHLA
eukprot:6025453-Amphidinium_carterae.1